MPRESAAAFGPSYILEPNPVTGSLFAVEGVGLSVTINEIVTLIHEGHACYGRRDPLDYTIIPRSAFAFSIPQLRSRPL